MMIFKPSGLLRLPRSLDTTSLGVAFGLRRPGLSGIQPALLQTERVPAQPQPAPGDRQQQDRRPDHGQPPQRRQRPHQVSEPHG